MAKQRKVMNASGSQVIARCPRTRVIPTPSLSSPSTMCHEKKIMGEASTAYPNDGILVYSVIDDGRRQQLCMGIWRSWAWQWRDVGAVRGRWWVHQLLVAIGIEVSDDADFHHRSLTRQDWEVVAAIWVVIETADVNLGVDLRSKTEVSVESGLGEKGIWLRRWRGVAAVSRGVALGRKTKGSRCFLGFPVAQRKVMRRLGLDLTEGFIGGRWSTSKVDGEK